MLELRVSIVLLVFTNLPGLKAAELPYSEGAADHSGEIRSRFPGGDWFQYAEVREAGFSSARLDSAKRFWQRRDSPAFLAVPGGAVVVAWGEVDRRFMCHSIRKSFLSALYGIYQEDIELERSVGEVGIDDHPSLSEKEKRARIIYLIRSRAGVYHDAAGESETMIRDRPPRGRYEPGAHWS